MEVKSCKHCGNLFNFVSGPPLCPTCMKKIDDKFPEVKQYIYEHPGAGMQEVSQENDVPTPIIKKWLREERLTFAEGSAIGLDCERCGKMILSGRFCADCKEKMKKELGGAYQASHTVEKKKQENTSAKMRFLQ